MLTIGVVYMVATMHRRHPDHHAEPAAAHGDHHDDRDHRHARLRPGRRRRRRATCRPGGCCSGGRPSWSARSSCCSGSSARSSARRSRRTDPLAQELLLRQQGAVGDDTGSAPTSSAGTCCRGSSSGARTILLVAPLATMLGTSWAPRSGLAMGYLGGVAGHGGRPHRRGGAGPARRHRRLPVHRGARGVGGRPGRRHRVHLHAADRPHGPLGGPGREPAGLPARRPGCSARAGSG